MSSAKIHTILNQLLSQVLTVAIHPSKIEIVQNLSEQLTTEITKISTEASLEKCRLLNVAIKDAFKNVAEDIAKLEAKIQTLENK